MHLWLIPERDHANTLTREHVWQQEYAELQFKLLYCFDTSASDNGLLLGVSKRSLKTPAPASPACHKPQSAKAFPFETPCGFCLRKASSRSLLSPRGSQIKPNDSSRSRVSAGSVGTHLTLQKRFLAPVQERGQKEQDGVAGNQSQGQNSTDFWLRKGYTTATLREHSVHIAKSWE